MGGVDMSKLRGFVGDFFETGCEGMIWCFFEDGKEWPDVMHPLNRGDHLTIFGENDKVLFTGEIDPDYKAGWIQYPRGKKGKGQPVALGYWIHWTQRGWNPDDWAMLFLREGLGGEAKRLRAELDKKSE